MSLQSLLTTQNDNIDDDKQAVIERAKALQDAIQNATASEALPKQPRQTDVLKTETDNQSQDTQENA